MCAFEYLRGRTPVLPMQHGTGESHNRWKGEREREEEREGGRERARGRESKRGEQRRGRSPLDPESANSNITIRPPGSERRRTLRLPPSSYVLSLSLFCVRLSLSLFLSLLGISFYHRALVSCHLGPLPLFSTRHPTPRPNTNLLSSPPFLHGRTSVLTSANSRGGRLPAQTPPTNAFSLGADEMADEKTFSTLAKSAATQRQAEDQSERGDAAPGQLRRAVSGQQDASTPLPLRLVELLSIILGLSRKKRGKKFVPGRDFSAMLI